MSIAEFRQSPMAKVVVIAVVVIALGLALFRARSVTRASGSAADETDSMRFLFKCTNADCNNVVEWTGAETRDVRLAQIRKDIAAGGSGYPTIAIPCPKCGHALVAAEHTADGQVRPIGGVTAPAVPVLPGVKSP